MTSYRVLINLQIHFCSQIYPVVWPVGPYSALTQEFDGDGFLRYHILGIPVWLPPFLRGHAVAAFNGIVAIMGSSGAVTIVRRV